MVPVPMPTSEKPLDCATSAPETATRPLLSSRPRIIVISVSTPCARIICWLKPVARIAAPICVPKNQYIKKPTISVTARPTTSVVCAIDRSSALLAILKVVSTPSRERFALPMMRKFTEYKAIIVKMPAKSAGIFIFVCKRPVTTPASMPATKAASRAVSGPKPATIILAAVAAPKGKLPSTVRSAISSTRKVT